VRALHVALLEAAVAPGVSSGAGIAAAAMRGRRRTGRRATTTTASP